MHIHERFRDDRTSGKWSKNPDGRLQYFVKSFKKSPKHKIQKMLSNYQVSPIPDRSIYLVDKPGSRFDDRLIALKGHKEIKFI